MKIGELSRRTGVATRLLRYYEEQGLLAPGRAPNGYREYGEDSVEQVERVRALIRSGLTTQFVRILIDMESVRGGELAAECSQTVAAMLSTELRAIEERIVCLTRSRETMRDWLARTDYGVVAAG
jgi:DNA-binding transcriptional MerR regulator